MRDADDNLWLIKRRPFGSLADEMFDHLFGGVKIGDHTFTHRANGLNGSGGATQHQLGVFTNSQYFFDAILDVIRDHRRFG